MFLKEPSLNLSFDLKSDKGKSYQCSWITLLYCLVGITMATGHKAGGVMSYRCAIILLSSVLPLGMLHEAPH